MLLLALLGDIRTYKIRNSITLPFIVLGAATNIYLQGLPGLRFSFMGMLVPFLLLAGLFVLKMLGAGDIKAFCAVGSIMGAEFVINAMAYSFLAGGVIASALILLRGNGKERFKHLFSYLKYCLLTLKLQPYGDFEDKSKGDKFRFAYAITCGTCIQAFLAAS